MFSFQLTARDPGSSARAGVISTDHGEIRTPIFMPVGTVGSVKGVYHKDLEEDIQAEIILGNTYHLYLRPGLDTLRKAGGLHRFEHWDRPILTDSGGFQVFSLAPIRKLTEEGCRFASHIDGSRHTFTPENNVDTQRIIGADIIMALDECCPGDADFRYAATSLLLTQGWLERFARHFDETEPLYGYGQTMFPIIQGCVYPDLRKQAVEHALGLDNAKRRRTKRRSPSTWRRSSTSFPIPSRTNGLTTLPFPSGHGSMITGSWASTAALPCSSAISTRPARPSSTPICRSGASPSPVSRR